MADDISTHTRIWSEVPALSFAGESVWNGTIAMVIAAGAPRRVMEIGIESGGHTALLLAYCQSAGAHLDLADIRPDPLLRALLARYLHEHEFHPFTALEAIPILPSCDLAILDADPNWYAVYHTLQLLFARAVTAGQHAPIVILHGAAWPNARRDTYRDPGRVPERHTYAQRGIVPGQSMLDDAGVNGTRFNASREGGSMNGVLTAAEDFIASWAEPIGMQVLPVLGGLAFLVPASRASAAVTGVLAEIFSESSLLRLCSMVDEARCHLAIDLAASNLSTARAYHALERARTAIARLSGALGE